MKEKKQFGALGITCIIDPGIPSNEVHFRNREGRLLGKIINIEETVLKNGECLITEWEAEVVD